MAQIKLKARIQFCMLILYPFLMDTHAQNILLFEDYETGDFEAKGWYDGFPDHRTTAEFKMVLTPMKDILLKVPRLPEQAGTYLRQQIRYT